MKSNENRNKTVGYFVINIFLISYLIFLAILPSAWYMLQHTNELPEFVIACAQIPAFTVPLLAYIDFSFYKRIVNEVFVDIDLIVQERLKVRENGLYEKTMKIADFYVSTCLWIYCDLRVQHDIISNVGCNF